MRDKVIFLVLGAVISVLFWIFRVELYEALYSVNGFSDQMYNTGAYGTVAAVTVAMSWGMAAIYYYVINSVKFDRWNRNMQISKDALDFENKYKKLKYEKTKKH